ncbi:MAG TPA: hypothetical protein VGB37_10370 [Candidatus Lokiarchaeia archaeon]
MENNNSIIKIFSPYFLSIILTPLTFFLWYKTKSLIIVGPLFIICFYLLVKIRIGFIKATNEKLTPTTIWELRRKAGPNLENYKKILRKRITLYEAMILEYQEKGIKINQVWIDNLELLKKELLEIEQKH